MNEIGLKSCPFCGGEAKYMEIKDFFVSRFVTCAKCGIETPRNCLNRKDAIKQWNRRTPMANIVEKLEEKQCQANKDMQISESYEDVQAYGGKYLAFSEAINILKQEINNGLE